ncbi:MAG: phosphoribosylglycinamide formyltransferase [Gemmatimonadetes bacterium]|nr:phosphoribosylglycinamide formyltransferase [Gemmatimonadota bacterium]
MSLRAAVFASGRGTNFEVLADAGAGREASNPPAKGKWVRRGRPRSWEVVLLVTDRAQAQAIERAKERGIPAVVVSPDEDPSTFGSRLLSRLSEEGVDIVLLAGYLRLVPIEVVHEYPHRILNIHPALLPGFGGKGLYGLRVHRAVLDSGARISGVTVHFVDEEYDRGRILAQWPVPVLSDDTQDTLAARVQEAEHLLYPVAVDALARAIADGSPAEAIPERSRHFVLSSTLPRFP